MIGLMVVRRGLVVGNKGADRFHLSAGYDVIYDFSVNQGDSLEVDGFQSWVMSSLATIFW